ncbi:hypothetical protein IVA95_22695 [Bradyrhizobium sp. 157]|uniref:hypothetical protein n=1 Tax=Bradyrhizobium sp. 157 TaxID=2782631 RepID=UPI001FF7D641|nr:hypothetical protein [Bradyrhizobium sp. 157]MCK1640338.1 hypothetical protein [Bradyrhizobium sp. 157]
MTLIRLRELERLFKHRYGRFLPDDDAGMDDLVIAAHHIAYLRGEVIAHIVAWARAWVPWLPPYEAERLAKWVAEEPRKWKADALAWRLRLSMAERTALKITTIGAFDMNRAEREADRKRKRREAERARRAKRSSGRSRGRPKKKAWPAGNEDIAGHGFSPKISDAAREPLDMSNAAAASKEESQNSSSRAAQSDLISLEEGQPHRPTSTTSRAASPQTTISSEPPPDVIEKAAAMARDHHNSGLHFVGRRETTRLMEKFWPGYVKGQIASGRRYYGRFDPKRDLRNWESGFRFVLDREYEARHRDRECRRKWQEQRKTSQQLRERDDLERWRRERLVMGSMANRQTLLADRERQKKANAARAVRDRIAERRAERAVRDLYGSS